MLKNYLNEKNYPTLKEKVYSETLDNGLEVIVIPKTGYKRTFAVFATKYGSLVNRFIPYGEKEYIDVPLGIAHFLEHKMFEMPDGKDATEMFADLGLDSNAATSYNLTAYLFSGTNNIKEGINLLLDFVQTPHFTDESIEREQGIIDQELKMYMDNPSDNLHLGLMQNLFKYYPLRYDIGGTIESIKEINKENITKCYNTFYHPSNMYLIIVGDIDSIMETDEGSVEKLLELVKYNQSIKKFPKILDIKKNLLVEDENVYHLSGSKKMDIMMAKAAVGVKLPFEKYGRNDSMMLQLKLKILLDATFGPNSDAFQEMLDDDLINGNIYFDVYVDDVCGFIKVHANTNKPKKFINYVKNKLLGLNNINLTEEEFSRYKKSILGGFIKSLNSLDFIAYSYLDYITKDSDIFDALSLTEALTLEDMKSLEKYFVKNAISDFTVLPKDELGFLENELKK